MLKKKATFTLPQISEIDALRHEVVALYSSQAKLLEERDHILALAIRLAMALEFPAGITTDHCTAIAEMSHVAVIFLPKGQISWHIAAQNLPFFQGITQYRFPLQDHCPSQEQYARMQEPFISNWSPLSLPTRVDHDVYQRQVGLLTHHAPIDQYMTAEIDLHRR